MKYIFFLIISAISLIVHANVLSEFQGESRTIVQTLLSQGHSKIGPLDLKKLDQELSETKWDSVKNVFLLGSGEGRATSIYLVAANKVIVNELALKLINRKMYPRVSLHEGLGANGYDDEKSNLSLSLEQIAVHPERKSLFEKHLGGATIRRKEDKVYQDRDGGTSVGGGGDATAIEFKKLMLDYAINLFQKNPEKLDKIIAGILDTDIEPNWDRDDYILEIRRDRKSFRIVIPSVLWLTYEWNVKNGAKLKEDLVKAVFNETFRDPS